MDPKTADDIRARSAAEAARRDHPASFPALPSVPAARYVDRDFFELERGHVFGRGWLLAALDDDLPEPGDVFGIDHLEVDLALVRGKDGRVRAFRNACSHRGTPLVAPGPGHVSRHLVCPYHQWSYDLEGALHAVPEARDWKELDRSCLGLRSVACDAFAGFVFVNFDEAPKPLRDSLGQVHAELDDEIGERAAGTRLRLVRRVIHEIPCNWKLASDANLETYHVNALHKDTAANVLDSRTTTISLFANGHSRMVAQGRSGDAPMPPLPAFPHASPLSAEGVLNYGLFPNVALVLSPILLFTVNAWPVGPDRTRYETWYMAQEPETDATKAIWDLVLGFNDTVIGEDVTVLAGMQRSLASGSLERIPLSYQERRIYHVHEEIDRRIGAGLIDEHLRVEPVLEAHREG